MKIQTLNQQDYSRKVMVSQDATDKNAEINQKLTDKLKEHALWFNYMLFRWISSTETINSIRINHYKKKTSYLKH